MSIDEIPPEWRQMIFQKAVGKYFMDGCGMEALKLLGESSDHPKAEEARILHNWLCEFKCNFDFKVM